MQQRYYFEIEKRDDNPLTFAYIWRAEDDATTAPPVKEFHSARDGDEAFRRVTKKAVKWINEHGIFV
jgi:hypothetical protein